MAIPVADMPPELIASLKYQQEHIEESRVGTLIGVTWSLWIVALVAIVLRFYAERIMRTPFRKHDALILLGFFFTTGVCINVTVGVRFGSGRHLILASPENIVNTAKLLFAFTYIYACANVTIKASLLLFFHRTFPDRTFRIALGCISTVVALWFLGMIFGTTFQCAPVDFTWNKAQPGQCINIEILFVTLGIVNAVTDIVIVIMPLPLIWKLKMPQERKIGICGIFALSSIVIVASIIRPIYLANLNTYDISYEGIDIGLWCIVEPALGIVGASLPLMAPLFNKVKELTSSAGKSSGATGSRSWDHVRIQDGQTGAPQKPWRKESEESARPVYVGSDNSPLTTHKEWADKDSENNVVNTSRNDLEMQNLPKTFFK